MWVICVVNVGKSTDMDGIGMTYTWNHKQHLFLMEVWWSNKQFLMYRFGIIWSPTFPKKWMAINFSHDVKNEQIEIYIIHVHSIEKNNTWDSLDKKNCLSIFTNPQKYLLPFVFLLVDICLPPKKRNISPTNLDFSWKPYGAGSKPRLPSIPGVSLGALRIHRENLPSRGRAQDLAGDAEKCMEEIPAISSWCGFFLYPLVN